MTRLRAMALVLAAATAAGACSPKTDLVESTSNLTFFADPSSLFLVQGTQETVTVNSLPTGPAPGTVDWTSSDERVATVDRSVTIGDPVTVRAVAPGTATLRATVRSTGYQTTLTVAVRVRAG